eukprot:2523461-Amphidinium_carterae.1
MAELGRWQTVAGTAIALAESGLAHQRFCRKRLLHQTMIAESTTRGYISLSKTQQANGGYITSAC